METIKAIFRNSKEQIPSPVHLSCELELICFDYEGESLKSSHVQFEFEFEFSYIQILSISRHAALITHDALKSVNWSIVNPNAALEFKAIEKWFRALGSSWYKDFPPSMQTIHKRLLGIARITANSLTPLMVCI